MLAKPGNMKKSRVTLVRGSPQRERINVKVRTEKDQTSPAKIELFDDPEEFECFRQAQRENDLESAKERGEAAENLLARQKWMERKINKAEEGLRESVALVEKLRSANMVNKQKNSVKIIDVDLKQRSTSKSDSNTVLKDFDNVRKVGSIIKKQVFIPPPTTTSSEKQKPKRIVTDKLRRKEATDEARNLAPPQKPPARQKKQVAVSDVNAKQSSHILTTGADSTPKAPVASKASTVSDAFKLSTILEATEVDGVEDTTTASSIAMDEVDLIPVRGPSSSEDNAATPSPSLGMQLPLSDVQTFSNASHQPANPTTRRTGSLRTARTSSSRFSPTSLASDLANTDLLSDSLDIDSVAFILQRIKEYRRKLEEEKENSESGFESIFTRNVEGRSQGAKLQNQAATVKGNLHGINQPSNKEKFHIDQQFIRKVLEFETSSPLFSSESKASSSSTTNNSSSSSRKPAKEDKRKVLKKQRVAAPKQISGSSPSSDFDNPREAKTQKPPKKISSENLLRHPQRTLQAMQPSPIDDVDKSRVLRERENFGKSENISQKFSPASQEKDKELRYYIEKLLSMRHEDVENLSVSSVHSTPQISEVAAFTRNDLRTSDISRISRQQSTDYSSSTNQSSEVRPLHSSLKSPNSFSSSSDSGKKVRFEMAMAAERKDSKTIGSFFESSLDATVYKSLIGRRDDLDSVDKANAASCYTQEFVDNEEDVSRLTCQQIQQLYAAKRSDLESQLMNLEKSLEIAQFKPVSDVKSADDEQKLAVKNNQTLVENPQDNVNIDDTSSLTNVTSFTTSATLSAARSSSLSAGRQLSSQAVVDCMASYQSVTEDAVTSSQLTTEKRIVESNSTGCFQLKLTKESTTITQQTVPKTDLHATDADLQAARRDLKSKLATDWSTFDISDVGTDSESGSRISRIDLSSDISSYN